MTTINHIRHGDVLLTRVDSFPEGKNIAQNNQHILAYGEVTGHCHRLVAPGLKAIKTGENTFLCLMEIGTLSHEEHATVEVPTGFWKMTMEREYDYCLENIRNVID